MFEILNFSFLFGSQLSVRSVFPCFPIFGLSDSRLHRQNSGCFHGFIIELYLFECRLKRYCSVLTFLTQSSL